ncbi:hypothetical protein [Paeniglutamicibacter cryotolerans]|uniref:Uncharacterized protein n=1 Tax=Paeniglutamicibacter cryotolerans TaxID=670079 RepID=A0A839QYF9_9MICC|nr:hypothetical protein [Paeniglutamicibacter cryotolerans]MBB2996991.1 hypothetical protein [Paeniglutamicibacter cryotolerans]
MGLLLGAVGLMILLMPMALFLLDGGSHASPFNELAAGFIALGTTTVVIGFGLLGFGIVGIIFGVRKTR